MDLRTLALALDNDPKKLVNSDEAGLLVASTAESVARHVARNLHQRDEILQEFDQNFKDNVWKALGRIWKELASSFSPSTQTVSSEDSRIELALGLGKLERNLIAGLGYNQSKAMIHEADIRTLIFQLTSFGRIEHPKFFTLHTVLVQLLSNLISPTSDDSDADRYANRYLPLYLSGERENDVIIRLLDSKDPKTNLSTLHLINNITRNAPSRLRLLLSEAGIKWLAKLLGALDGHLETHEGRFELTCEIFNGLIDLHLQAELFAKLSSPDEPLSPSQATFLKLLDSRINAQQSLSSSSPTPNPRPNPNIFLIPVFHVLAGYCLVSMRSLPDDARLPKVFEGLVLVTEMLSAIGLSVQGRKDKSKAMALPGSENYLAPEDGGEEEMVRELKSEKEGEGVIKPTIELLAQLNLFLPRIKPLRSDSSATPSDTSSPDQTLPFTNIKRDLVRLLSVLTFEDTGVGDQVRIHGGVQVILGLCEVDERNPYLRELALFTVRNLMLNNPENQKIISQMDPLGLVGENGELLPLPDRMKKTPSPGPVGSV